MMDDMMKKGKGMMSDMGGMDAMMAKGKSMCEDMMGSSDNGSSCSNDDSSDSCATSKETATKKAEECCTDGSCEL